MTVMQMQLDASVVPLKKAAPGLAISAALEDALNRALEKSPDRRWTNAAEFARGLKNSREGRANPAASQRRPKRGSGSSLRQ
jgi:post-segregation antitoxin (ccd killing protein)